MTLAKRQSLVICGLRRPSLMERLLLGITCIGYCTGSTPDGLQACAKFCGPELLEKLGRADMHHALPEAP